MSSRQAGIFQLKWQEDFGLEERERVRRGFRLKKEISEWTGRLVGHAERKGLSSLLSQLGLPHDINSMHLFAIARPQARFAGITVANEQCAVASWRQFFRARFELGPQERTFEALERSIRQEPDRRPKVELEWMSFSVAGFKVEAQSLVTLPNTQTVNSTDAGAV